jgi:hypothetical protein
VAISAFAIPEPIPDGPLTTPQALGEVTGCACECLVLAFEWVVGELRMVQCADLERIGEVAGIALALGRSQTKLSGVNVTVTSSTLARRTAIGRTAPARPVLLRWAVAAVARGLRMSARERPSAVVNSWGIPSARGMTVGATPLAHLCRELTPMRVFVAVDTTLCLQPEVVVGALSSMTAGARDRQMFAVEGKVGASMLLHREGGRPEPTLVMAGAAIRVAETTAVHVAMAVPTSVELQATISTLWR